MNVNPKRAFGHQKRGAEILKLVAAITVGLLMANMTLIQIIVMGVLFGLFGYCLYKMAKELDKLILKDKIERRNARRREVYATKKNNGKFDEEYKFSEWDK